MVRLLVKLHHHRVLYKADDRHQNDTADGCANGIPKAITRKTLLFRRSGSQDCQRSKDSFEYFPTENSRSASR
jgi:hypothetical protein